jgi:DNA-binding transcriptional MerR regulator
MNYRIGEVAKKIGVSSSTLRFYDKHGLLPFVQRDNNGNRRFTDNDLNYLDVITVLKRGGVTVETIAKFI